MLNPVPVVRHRICIVDADIKSRKKLIAAFEADARFEVFEYETSEAFFSDINYRSPNCVILDLQPPCSDSSSQVRNQMRSPRNIPAILLTTDKDHEFTVNTATVDVRDIFQKPYKTKVLLEAAERCCGEAALVSKSPRLSDDPEYVIQHWPFITQYFGLSQRQYEIAQRICRSMSAANIASDLNISSNTVRMHIKALYEKLNVNDRVGVAMRCVGADALIGTER